MTKPATLEFDELDGVSPARQQRSRIAQERLLEAAEATFASRGYHNAHVTEIAAAAGYSIGAFYLRFRDKDSVFRALRRRFAIRGRENIEAFFALPRWAEEPPSQLVRAYVTATVRTMTRNAGFFRALYQRSLDGEATEDWPELRMASRLAAERLAAFLRTRAPEVDRPDLEPFCTVCLSAVEGAVIHRLLNVSISSEIDNAFFLKSLTLMATATLGLPPAEDTRARA
ncbi:TetR/AcrR family transcriptional regulator [Phenylobacterium sp.]|uniref:TetR/AcrR family transcriptional regulator n=1 Tax=Phenylobacterium sp. TaxID=1871053 RepID=UPI00301E2E30